MDLRAVEEPVNLRSDNVAGVAPEILAAIAAANAGTAPSYGADPITARLQDVFAELFGTRCFVQPVATGTATNALALALIAPPYGAVYFGFAAALPFWWMSALVAAYGAILMLDSASLTVGALGAAAPERRGSTLAVHTTLGTSMAFLGPLASGFALDLTGGGATMLSWVACFLVLAAGIAFGPLALWQLGGRGGAPAGREPA